MARIDNALGKHERAVRWLEAIMDDRRPAFQEAEAMYLLAANYLGMGDRMKAAEAFKAVKEKFPGTQFAKEAQKQLNNM